MVKATAIFLVLTWLFSVTPEACPELRRDELRQYDHELIEILSASYHQSRKYDAVLSQVATQLQPQTKAVFPDSRKVGLYYVYPNFIGFNAFAGYEIILLDRLLLDVTYNLTRGYVYHGALENQYTDRLIWTIQSIRVGVPIDPTLSNPFNLPPPPRLTAAQKQCADRLFIEIAAFLLAHEGSHIFDDHQIQTERLIERLKSRPHFTGQNFDAVLNEKLSPMLELEADRKGAQLLLRSGFRLEGAVLFLRFQQVIELNFGRHPTHPSAEARIQSIRQVEQNLNQQ